MKREEKREKERVGVGEQGSVFRILIALGLSATKQKINQKIVR